MIAIAQDAYRKPENDPQEINGVKWSGKWAVGIDIETCPNCGATLSYDLSNREFCRGCQKNIKNNLDQRGKLR